MKDKTNVQITTETRDRLVALGGKGDSYEDVIKRLLDGEVEEPMSHDERKMRIIRDRERYDEVEYEIG